MKNDFGRRGWLRVLLAISIVPAGCVIGSYVMARVMVALNGGFGAGDLPVFFYSTLPFAVVLLLPALVALVFRHRVHPFIRVALALVVGVASGFIWTVFNRWMLGPWFGAWSFPVLYCWVFGGALGIVGATMVQTLFPKIGAAGPTKANN